MTTKLTKGRYYAGIHEGIIDYGRYIGRVPGYFLFEKSGFASALYILSKGIKQSDFQNWIWIEIPQDIEDLEYKTIEYLRSVLPE